MTGSPATTTQHAVASAITTAGAAPADLRPHVIEETCARVRNWWRTRTSSPAAALERAHGYLSSPSCTCSGRTPALRKRTPRLPRTAVLVLDPNGVTSSPLWRNDACIAVVASELVDRSPA
ncbi:hypothetical protein [Streptomyces sp. DT195]|uniref:hypothetical protein n=1 Tax=Streptomyces sp. DT195 TaxID=3393419 RepID=UPI003CEB6C85